MTTREEFIDRWDDHIGELTRLGWYLDSEGQEELDDAKERLREILRTAAENRDRESEHGRDAEYAAVGEVDEQ